MSDIRKALRDGLGEHVGAADALTPEADARLRRRLELAPPGRVARGTGVAMRARRPWITVTAASFAGICAVTAGILLWQAPGHVGAPSPNAAASVAAFLDVSAQPWRGTLSSAGVSVLEGRASLARESVAYDVAAPAELAIEPEGTRLVHGHLALDAGARPTKATVTLVSYGRVVVLGSRATIAQEIERGWVELESGAGAIVDLAGHSTPLVVGQRMAWQGATLQPGTPRAVDAPAGAPPPRGEHGRARLGDEPDVDATSGRAGAMAPNAMKLSTDKASCAASSTALRVVDKPCTFRADCGPTQTCRRGDQGDSICMGLGRCGDACWFDSDCSVGSCVNKRCR